MRKTIWRGSDFFVREILQMKMPEEFLSFAKFSGAGEFFSVIVLLGAGHRMALIDVNNLLSVLNGQSNVMFSNGTSWGGPLY
jgi:hypothetical protein